MDSRDDPPASAQLLPMNLVLRDLAANESGVGFIYSTLNVLAERYGLNDVAIVLVSTSFSTQVFRLDGRAIDANAVAATGTSPGVYCSPDVVPVSELEMIYAACQEAYSYRFVRNIPRTVNSSAIVVGPTTLDAPPANEPLLVVAPIDTVTTTTKRVRQVSRNEPSARSQYTRVVTSRLLVLIDVTTLILTAADIHGPLRLLFGLCLGLVIPGWCLVTPLKLDNAPLELGLILSVSLSLFMVVAQILMTMDLWHLVALEEISCLICLPFLLNQAKMVTMWSPRRATKAGPRHTKLPTAP